MNQITDLSAPRQTAGGQKGLTSLIVGNEKGGAGKSTLAIHTAIALIKCGLKVGVIDLDRRQQSMSRFFDYRRRWMLSAGVDLAMPKILDLIDREGYAPDPDDMAREDWREVLSRARKLDILVVDTPGGVTPLSKAAHEAADIIVTPMNDSFIDFELLGSLDPRTFKVERPSQYAEMIWESRKRRSARDRRSIDWVVVRNRLSTLDARNKRRVADNLAELSRRVAFRIAPGVSERVIYRELFPRGLTVLDMGEAGVDAAPSLSHVAARQELRDLVIALKLPSLAGQPLGF